jgi:hypothetical protein
MATLTAAQNWVSEEKMASNTHLHTLLSREALTGWNNAVAHLIENHKALLPQYDQSHGGIVSLTTTSKDIRLTSRLLPLDVHNRIFDIQTASILNSESGLSAAYKQSVRLLTLLTPYAESPAPLILKGCINSLDSGIDIQPLDSDTDAAGEAIRMYSSKPCDRLATINLHKGKITFVELERPLWWSVFTVNQEAFKSMARSEAELPDQERRYWLADKTDFTGGHWTRSLGYPKRPVALLFPRDTECPNFSDGVRIVGVVFIDNDCSEAIAEGQLEIFGTLAVNGNLNAGVAELRLKHIQAEDNQLKYLDFPVLRGVRIPGSWRDF